MVECQDQSDNKLDKHVDRWVCWGLRARPSHGDLYTIQQSLVHMGTGWKQQSLEQAKGAGTGRSKLWNADSMIHRKKWSVHTWHVFACQNPNYYWSTTIKWLYYYIWLVVLNLFWVPLNLRCLIDSYVWDGLYHPAIRWLWFIELYPGHGAPAASHCRVVSPKFNWREWQSTLYHPASHEMYYISLHSCIYHYIDHCISLNVTIHHCISLYDIT